MLRGNDRRELETIRMRDEKYYMQRNENCRLLAARNLSSKNLNDAILGGGFGKDWLTLCKSLR